MKPLMKAAFAVLAIAIVLIAAVGITVATYHPMNTVISEQGKVAHQDIPYYNTTLANGTL